MGTQRGLRAKKDTNASVVVEPAAALDAPVKPGVPGLAAAKAPPEAVADKENAAAAVRTRFVMTLSGLLKHSRPSPGPPRALA
jgi:hypothetical protein